VEAPRDLEDQWQEIEKMVLKRFDSSLAYLVSKRGNEIIKTIGRCSVDITGVSSQARMNRPTDCLSTTPILLKPRNRKNDRNH
jgi:hypothetical protein